MKREESTGIGSFVRIYEKSVREDIGQTTVIVCASSIYHQTFWSGVHNGPVQETASTGARSCMMRSESIATLPMQSVRNAFAVSNKPGNSSNRDKNMLSIRRRNDIGFNRFGRDFFEKRKKLYCVTFLTADGLGM